MLNQPQITLVQSRQRQILADSLLAEQLKNENAPPSSDNESLTELFRRLSNLKDYPQLDKSNVWARDYGIRCTLTHYLGSITHIIDPRLSSISSPLDRNKQLATQGALNYAKTITGFQRENDNLAVDGLLQKDGGELKKPILMILNTTSISPEQVMAGISEGGSHWVVCVILPKRYKTPLGQSLNNDNEQIIYIDSLQGHTNPLTLIHALTHAGTENIETVEGIKTKHVINASFPNAEIHISNKQLQLESSDCGWWAVYNAFMLVLTGNMNYLDHFKHPSREPAYALRHLFSKLAEQESTNAIHAFQFTEIDESQYIIADKPKIKDRRKAEFVTNIIAVLVIATGAFVAFTSGIISHMGWSIGTLATGLTISGIGLLPRLTVDLLTTKDVADNEVKSKEFIIDSLRILKNEQERAELTNKYKLTKSNKAKWVNFVIKLLAIIFGYIAATVAASILKFEQSTTNQDKKSDYLAIRFVLTGASILGSAIFSIISLYLENKTKQRQNELDNLEKEYKVELNDRRIAIQTQNSQRRILQILGVNQSLANEIIHSLGQTTPTANQKEKSSIALPSLSSDLSISAQVKPDTANIEHGQGKLGKKTL